MSSNKLLNNASKLPIYKPPSLVDNIITKVKEKSGQIIQRMRNYFSSGR